MDDLISRRAAIEEVEFGITYAKAFDIETGEVRELFKESNKALQKAVERIKALPSAEKKGKWVLLTDYLDGQTYKCSACNEIWTFIDGTPEDNGAFFCPNCGADMRGEQNE